MAEPQFYRLHSPDYDSDYKDSFINGSATHQFSLPGLDCPDCSAWSGSRVLPFECPKSFRNHKNIIDGWPIPPDAHRELRAQVLSAIREDGHSIETLEPGDTFQPAVLDIPSRPKSDFLWSTIGTALVSERIKSAFESADLKGVRFFPVQFHRVGKASASEEAPIPSTGEPEDIIEELHEFLTHDEVDPYYEMIVTASSAPPPGTDIVAVCKICGRESFDSTKRRLFMDSAIWRGQDVFYLHTTLWIIITAKVHRLIADLNASNAVMLPMRST